MKLDRSPFVVVSVIGQELLSAGHHQASVVVLEAALRIGTCSLKLRGSVFSALSSAQWSLGGTEKSVSYMQQDLEVAKSLGTEETEGSAEEGREGKGRTSVLLFITCACFLIEAVVGISFVTNAFVTIRALAACSSSTDVGVHIAYVWKRQQVDD